MTEVASRGSLLKRPRRTYLATGITVAAAVAVAAVIFGGSVLFDDDGRDRGLPASKSRKTAAPAPSVVAEFDLLATSDAPVFAKGSAWVATDGGQLTRIDAATNKSEVVLKGDGLGGASAMYGPDSIWFQHDAKGLYRVDPGTGVVSPPIPEDIEPAAAGFGSLWGLDVGHEVLRVNPNTYQVLARLDLSDNEWTTHGCVEPFRLTCPNYLTVHRDRVVVFIEGEDAAVHIDPATNRITKRVKMPANAAGFYGYPWVSPPWTMTQSGLAQVDLDSGKVLARIPLRADQRALSYAAERHSVAMNEGTAWLVADTITTQIDLKRGKVVKTFKTPGAGGVIAASFGHGDLWVSYEGGTIRRVNLPGS
jgi:hypothetical protein